MLDYTTLTRLIWAAYGCLDAYRKEPDGDTFRVINAKCHINMTGDHAWVFVAGTDEVADWAQNFNVTQVEIPGIGLTTHSGFLAHSYLLLDKILGRLKDLDPVFVSLAGHSLGGASATVLQKFLEQELNREIDCVTFGAPRVFGYGASSRNLVRVCNAGDPVPHLPTAWRFKHTGKGYRLEHGGDISKQFWWNFLKYVAFGTRGAIRDAIQSHSLETYLQRLHRARWRTQKWQK